MIEFLPSFTSSNKVPPDAMQRFSFSSSALLPRFLGLSLLLLLLGGLQNSRAQLAATDTTHIGFDEAVRIALDQNTDVKRAQAQARQSNVEVRSEWSDFAPDLNLSTNVARRFGRSFSQVTGDFTTRSTDFFSLGGRSSITLFNGFENIASLRQTKDQAQADQVDLKRTRREVVFTVMDQFISLLESREQVRVRREELQALRQQLRQTEEFVDAGSSPVSDLYQLQADVANAEQQLLQAKRENEVSKTQLIQTLQLNPRRPYDFQIPDLTDDSLGTATYDLSALMEEAFEQRLGLRVAKLDRRAAERGIRAARSSYYPSLSISGSYGTDWQSRGRIPDPDNPGEFIQPDFFNQLDNNRSGSVSLSLSIPIFDRFRRSTQVEQAQVQAQNAEYALDDQRQQVALQVRQAYLDYQNAIQQLQAANKGLRAAEQARTAAQERYELGSASIVELRNANRDYVDAASQQIRARYNLLFQEKRIDFRVGRLDPQEPLMTAQSPE